MRNAIIGGIGVLWGGGVIIYALSSSRRAGGGAYGAGQTFGGIFGFVLFVAGCFYLVQGIRELIADRMPRRKKKKKIKRRRIEEDDDDADDDDERRPRSRRRSDEDDEDGGHTGAAASETMRMRTGHARRDDEQRIDALLA